jgi:hypothetical protein
MKTLNYLFYLFVFFNMGSCKPQITSPYMYDNIEDIWEKLEEKIPSSLEKLDMHADTSCYSIIYGSKEDFKMWGKTYKADGFLVIDHKKYLATGRMANGLPTGTWQYTIKHNCVFFEEDFRCGVSGYKQNCSCLRFEGYGVSCSSNVKSENYRGYIIELIRFRNKLHKKIYNTREVALHI